MNYRESLEMPVDKRAKPDYLHVAVATMHSAFLFFLPLTKFFSADIQMYFSPPKMMPFC